MSRYTNLVDLLVKYGPNLVGLTRDEAVMTFGLNKGDKLNQVYHEFVWFSKSKGLFRPTEPDWVNDNDDWVWRHYVFTQTTAYWEDQTRFDDLPCEELKLY